jgi:para-aminobenzoate synthetase component I
MTQVSALDIRELTLSIDVIACFEAFRMSAYPWLLDSGAAPGVPTPAVSRYSMMGADPYLVVRARGDTCELESRRGVSSAVEVGRSTLNGDPLEIARSFLPSFIPELAHDLDPVASGLPLLGGAVGYLGYELGAACEPVSLSARDDFDLPDLVLLYIDRLLVIDHIEERAYAVGLGFEDEHAVDTSRERAQLASRDIEQQVRCTSPQITSMCSVGSRDWLRQRQPLDLCLPSDAVAGLSAEAYGEAVNLIRDEIAAGNIYQANLTQRIDLPSRSVPGELDADVGFRTYCALRSINPAPFAAFIVLPEVTIVSSSPERFLSVDRNGVIESRPIKGTRRRGSSQEEDALLAKELERSVKDRAENLMIVDLVRNDLGRICETGSVEVSELMAIEPYASVFQMVSTVRGILRPDCGVDDLLRATFPPGSMTGTPKIAAMQLIDRIEPVRRGIYSGAIGYFDVAGGLDLSVVIRTLFVRDGTVHIHSGGAVVSDSVPADEYREAIDKIRALLWVVGVEE